MCAPSFATGRDQFVAVGKAFERLKAGSAGREGTRPSVVLLLLQVCHLAHTQSPLTTPPPRPPLRAGNTAHMHVSTYD